MESTNRQKRKLSQESTTEDIFISKRSMQSKGKTAPKRLSQSEAPMSNLG